LNAFKAEVPQFEALGVQVLGLSIDTKFSQKAFADGLQLNFPLVSDANREVGPQLGTLLAEVAGIKQVNMRAVLLIDAEMTLRWRFGADASTLPDVAEVLTETRAAFR
jgi:peroxiredoxin